MIYIDTRTGSNELVPLLKGRGLPVTPTRLDYGDVSFLGLGPDGEPVSVGVEVKTIHDVLKCVCDGRFAGHQLPGLVQSYDQVWLLIEGEWRTHPKSGILQYHRKRGEWRECTVGTRRFMASDLMTWLLTMQIKGGIRVARVTNWDEAVVWIKTLYGWWTTDKGWDKHQSHLAFHDGTRHGTPFKRDRATRMVASLSDRALLVRPTLCRMVAAQLPGVGWNKSKAVADKYRTVQELVDAVPGDLMELPGIGPKLATGIYESLRSRK